MKDLIIIGGGPAGLSAAVHASRRGLSTLLIEKSICGGLPLTAPSIENYPGFPDGIGGLELLIKFKEHALKVGVEILEFNEVMSVKNCSDSKEVKTEKEIFKARAVILAAGGIHRKLNIPGEDEYTGKGVSYCATCDGAFFRDMDVAVVGCGDSGLQEGAALAEYAKSITFIDQNSYMTAEMVFRERIGNNPKSNIMLNHVVTSVNGDASVNSVTVRNLETEEEMVIDVSGVFIYAGFLPNTKFLNKTVELDSDGYVIIGERMGTSASGIFAVGYMCTNNVRNITTACNEGALAATAVRDYLKGSL